MLQAAERWTAARVRALPDDGKRYESVDGELLVTPSPSRAHQRAVLELAGVLAGFVKATGLGEVIISPADIELDAETLVQPDVFVEGRLGGRIASNWNSGAPLLLVVEVLSAGTAKADRSVKRRLYQRAGVPEYWILDLDARLVERWRPADKQPEVQPKTLIWRPPGVATPLALDLVALFSAVLDRE